MKKLLESQADRIDTVLTTHKVPAQVTGGTVTPRWVRFTLTKGSKASEIRCLSEEFVAVLDVPQCRVQRRGTTINIEIPRDDPQPVRLLPLYRQLKSESMPPVTAILGLAENGAPLLIRLPSPDVAHILVVGTTGSGKTTLLQTITLSLAMLNRPDDVTLVLISPKGNAFAPFEPLPHLIRPVIRATAKAAETLKGAVRLMNQERDVERHVVIVIDGLADLAMGGSTVQKPLGRLLQEEHGTNVHIIAATQEPSVTALKPLVKSNFPVRLVGQVANAADARIATGWNGTGAERLQGRGDFIAVAEGELTHFQSAHVTEAEIRNTVRKVGSDDNK